MTGAIKRLNRICKLLGPGLLGFLGVALFSFAGQAGVERSYIVEGLSTDRENSVNITLFMEPREKFDAIFAMDPLAATDPVRIIADAAQSAAEPDPLDKTLFLDSVLGVSSGVDVPFDVDVTTRIGELGDTFQILPEIPYIVLAVYTDNVLRSTDEISPPSLVLIGTESPGVFIFRDLPPTPTPTQSGQPTPTPTFTPEPPAAWPVAIGEVSGDRLVQGVAIDDVVTSNPNLDIVAVAQSGQFKVYNHLGVPWPEYEVDLNVTIDTAPITADVYGDGEIEILIGTNQLDSDRNIIFSAANALLVIDNEFKQRYTDLVAMDVAPNATDLRTAGLLNAIHYIPEGQAVFSTPAVRDIDDEEGVEVVFTTRPVDPDDSSYIQVVSFSENPDVEPVEKMSIKPRRLVKTGKVLITELNPNTGSGLIRAELTNVSGVDVDLKNWSVLFYDNSTWPEPTDVVPIEGGDGIRSLSFPGEIITITDDDSPDPDTSIPDLGIRGSLSWALDSTQMAVALRDNRGRIVDFVTTGVASQIQNPVPITPEDWAGSGLLLSATPGLTFQRVANASNEFRDNNNRGDWVANAVTSLGSLNTDLALPFFQGVGILGTPVVADVDGDGDLEIVVGSNSGDVYSLTLDSTPDLTPIFELDDPGLEQPSILRALALVNVDADPAEEILFAVSERDRALPGRTQLHLINGDGTPVFADSLIFRPTQTISSLSTPVVGRLSTAPDAPLLALFATTQSLVAINLETGDVIFDETFSTTRQIFASSAPAIGQAEPQPAITEETFELFIGGGDGNLYGRYYDSTNQALVEAIGISEHTEPTIPGTGVSSPILGGIELADLSGNRQTDVVYTNEAGFINVFSPKINARADGEYLEPTDFPWPAFKHDRARTGSFSESTLPNPVAPYRESDLNRDGFVDEKDLFEMARKWSRQGMFKIPGVISAPDGQADDSNETPHVQLLGVISDLKN